MNEHAREARRAYKREWAKKNPDKIRAQQERYWSKKAAEQAAAFIADKIKENEEKKIAQPE